MIIPQQVVSAARPGNTSIIVLCDDTDVFILLAHFYIHEKLTFQLSVQGTNPSRTVVDIVATAAKHQEIIPHVLAANALSGCDTLNHMWGIEKGSIIKHLLKGSILINVGNIASHLDDITAESTNFVAACYGCRAR